MIVVMKPGSSKAQVDHIVNLVREMGLKEHIIVGTERTVVACVGNERFKERSRLETVEGVENIDAIAAVDGVDVVYIGPSDLASSAGLPPMLALKEDPSSAASIT